MKGMTSWLIVGGHIQVGYTSEGPNGPDVFHHSTLSKCCSYAWTNPTRQAVVVPWFLF